MVRVGEGLKLPGVFRGPGAEIIFRLPGVLCDGGQKSGLGEKRFRVQTGGDSGLLNRREIHMSSEVLAAWAVENVT